MVRAQQQARVMRFLPRDSGRRRWLSSGGHSWHIATRSNAGGERPLAGAALFLSGLNQSQLAQHGARAQQARVLRLLPRDSEHWRACAARDAWHWLGIGGCNRSRRTTTARRSREASRRRSALLWRTSWPQPAQYGARAQQARVLHLLHKCSERRLGVGLALEGHVAPRSCARGERPLAGAAPFCWAQANHS